MAQRVVILSIPYDKDNKAADEFARDLVAAMDAGVENWTEMPHVPPGTEIHALLARPLKGCVHRSIQGWTRVPRFGWFVCPQCRRPTNAVIRNWMANHLNGCVNLLAELFPDREWPQPLYAHEKEPVRKLTSQRS